MNNNPQSTTHESPTLKKPKSSFIVDLIEIIAASLAAIILIMTFCLRVCTVDGHSMDKTLSHGEVLLISSIGYTPKENDIIVFQDLSLGKAVVKRIISTGDKWVKIDYDNAIVYVSSDNTFTEDEIINESSYLYLDIGSYNQSGELIRYVPKGSLFVMGDNRNNSSDSRGAIGLVNENLVLGKVILRISPSDKIGTVK